MFRIDTSQITGRLNEDIESVLCQLLFIYYISDYRPTKEDLLKGCEKAINKYYSDFEDGELEN